MGNLQKRICSLSFSGCSISKLKCRIAAFLIVICLREVGVLEMLSVASRKLVKLLLAYFEEIVMDALEGKRCHKMTENTYPLANTSFLPRAVLQYSHGVGMAWEAR